MSYECNMRLECNTLHIVVTIVYEKIGNCHTHCKTREYEDQEDCSLVIFKCSGFVVEIGDKDFQSKEDQDHWPQFKYEGVSKNIHKCLESEEYAKQY